MPIAHIPSRWEKRADIQQLEALNKYYAQKSYWPWLEHRPHIPDEGDEIGIRRNTFVRRCAGKTQQGFTHVAVYPYRGGLIKEGTGMNYPDKAAQNVARFGHEVGALHGNGAWRAQRSPTG